MTRRKARLNLWLDQQAISLVEATRMRRVLVEGVPRSKATLSSIISECIVKTLGGTKEGRMLAGKDWP